MASCRTRGVLVVLLLFAAGARAQLDWGFDRRLHSGIIGQDGIAADRAPGSDTAFAGLIASGHSGDTIRVLRTTDQGEHWQPIWTMSQPDHTCSNLALRVCAGQGGWVIVAWLDRAGANNGDVAGARISFDGNFAFTLQPVAPGPDTLTWLTLTRSFDSLPVIYVVWQDELGRGRAERAPRILITRSSDLGQTWTAPIPVRDSFETPAFDHGAPGHLYVAARSVRRQDIAVVFSTDQGESWRQSWLTNDSTVHSDMFPSVACTHDSAAGERAWVSYDSYGTTSGWDVDYAYTVNAGGTWVLGRTLDGGSGDQLLSNLDCTSSGSRRVRAVDLSDDVDGFHVYYRCAQAANPTNWSSAIVISDTQATDAMAPVVTSYGVASDTLDKGLVFYAGIGPFDLWYDAQQFTGLSEGPLTPAPKTGLQTARLARDELEIRVLLARRERLELNLYTIDGRRVRKLTAGSYPAGELELRLPVAGLAAGSYLVQMHAGQESGTFKTICVR